jgi:hypothetical protein
MTERRCPNCGGLVGQGAAWCGQCLTPLGENVPVSAEPPKPEPAQVEKSDRPMANGQVVSEDIVPDQEPAPPVPPRTKKSSGRFRAVGEGLLWVCPECDMENPIEASACGRCGTHFRSLFHQGPVRPSVEPGRAAALSLVFPGLGHRALGRSAEGLARAVVFLWTIGMGLAILATAGAEGAGPFRALLLVLFAAAAIVYATTATDARRIARGEEPMMSSRILLYGSTGLMFVIVVMLVVSGMRASSS